MQLVKNEKKMCFLSWLFVLKPHWIEKTGGYLISRIWPKKWLFVPTPNTAFRFLFIYYFPYKKRSTQTNFKYFIQFLLNCPKRLLLQSFQSLFSLCSVSRKPILLYKICSVNYSSGTVNTKQIWRSFAA